MFDKWDAINSHTVRKPSLTSNIQSIIFYSDIMSEFLRITRSKLLLQDVLLITKNVLDVLLITKNVLVINQGGSKHMFLKQIEKTFNRYPEVLQKYNFMDLDSVSKIAAT